MSGVDASYEGSDGAGRVGDLPGVRATLQDRKERALRAARMECPVDTGVLWASIRAEDGTDANGPYADIIAGIPGRTHYLGYVLYGTDPHIIRPRRAKALRFVSRTGQIVFAMKVNHPGTAPRDFLQAALRAAG